MAINKLDTYNSTEPSVECTDFLPLKRFSTPQIIVTPVEDPDHTPAPLSYFVEGYYRHHEKLSGLAGDWTGNKHAPSKGDHGQC